MHTTAIWKQEMRGSVARVVRLASVRLCTIMVTVLTACDKDKPSPSGTTTPTSPGGGVTPPAAAASVTVTPSTLTIAKGGTTTVSATVKDAAGNSLAGRTIQWTSANGAIVTVSSAGEVTGVAGGTAVVTASVDGKTGNATINVLPSTTAAVDTIQFAPDISTAARSKVASVQTIFDSVSSSARTIATERRSPILALTSTGSVIFVGQAGTVNAPLGPRSSALALLSLGLSPRARPSLSDAQLNVRATAHPRFNDFVAALARGAEAGQSITENTAAIEFLAQIMTDVAQDQIPPSSLNAFSLGRIAFPKPFFGSGLVETFDVPGEKLRVSNGTYFGFGLRLNNAVTGIPLGEFSHLKRRQLEPFKGDFGSRETLDVNAVSTGETAVMIGFHPEAQRDRCKTLFTFAMDVIVEQAFGKSALPIADALGTEYSGDALCTRDIKPADYLKASLGAFISNVDRLREFAEAVVKYLFEGKWSRTALILGFTSTIFFGLAKVATFLNNVAKYIGIGLLVLDWGAYGGENLRMWVCQLEGSVTPCVRNIAVSPAALTLQRGESRQLSAIPSDSVGRSLTYPLAWRSLDTSVVTVSGAGRVSAAANVQNGKQTMIEVEWGTSKAQVPVTIGLVPVSQVVLRADTGAWKSAPRRLPVPESRPIYVTLYASDRTVLNPVERQITWQSSDPRLATVDNAGRITAVRGGTVTITATTEGVSATVQITADVAAVGLYALEKFDGKPLPYMSEDATEIYTLQSGSIRLNSDSTFTASITANSRDKRTGVVTNESGGASGTFSVTGEGVVYRITKIDGTAISDMTNGYLRDGILQVYANGSVVAGTGTFVRR